MWKSCALELAAHIRQIPAIGLSLDDIQTLCLQVNDSTHGSYNLGTEATIALVTELRVFISLHVSGKQEVAEHAHRLFKFFINRMIMQDDATSLKKANLSRTDFVDDGHGYLITCATEGSLDCYRFLITSFMVCCFGDERAETVDTVASRQIIESGTRPWDEVTIYHFLRLVLVGTPYRRVDGDVLDLPRLMADWIRDWGHLITHDQLSLVERGCLQRWASTDGVWRRSNESSISSFETSIASVKKLLIGGGLVAFSGPLPLQQRYRRCFYEDRSKVFNSSGFPWRT